MTPIDIYTIWMVLLIELHWQNTVLGKFVYLKKSTVSERAHFHQQYSELGGNFEHLINDKWMPVS